MSSVALPFAFVDMTTDVHHFTEPVALSIDPKAGVHASVWIPAFAESMSLVVEEHADVTATVGVFHDSFAVAMAHGVAHTDVGFFRASGGSDGTSG